MGMRLLITTDLIAEHVDYVARLGEAFPAWPSGPWRRCSGSTLPSRGCSGPR